MGWKDSRAGSTIEEIGFGLQIPLIHPPTDPTPKTRTAIVVDSFQTCNSLALLLLDKKFSKASCFSEKKPPEPKGL